ncbi:unnamed protein product [Sphagnum balticum]
MARFMHCISFVLICTLLHTSHATIQCRDDQAGKVHINGQWQSLPTAANPDCTSARWCVRARGHGVMKADGRCTAMDQFGSLSGQLTVCCCDSAMCNGGDNKTVAPAPVQPNRDPLAPQTGDTVGPAGVRAQSAAIPVNTDAANQQIRQAGQQQPLPDLPQQRQPQQNQPQSAPNQQQIPLQQPNQHQHSAVEVDSFLDSLPEILGGRPSNETGASKPEPKPEPKAEPKPEPKAEPKTLGNNSTIDNSTLLAKPEPEPKSIKPQPKPEPELNNASLAQNAKPEPEPKRNQSSKAEPEPKSEPKGKAEPEPKAKSEPEPKPKSEPEPKSEPKAKSEPEPKAKSEPEPKPKSEPEPKAKSEPEPKPKSEPEPKGKAEPEPKSEPTGNAVTDDRHDHHGTKQARPNDTANKPSTNADLQKVAAEPSPQTHTASIVEQHFRTLIGDTITVAEHECVITIVRVEMYASGIGQYFLQILTVGYWTPRVRQTCTRSTLLLITGTRDFCPGVQPVAN